MIAPLRVIDAVEAAVALPFDEGCKREREIVDSIGGWRAGLPVIQDARYLFEAARRNARFAYVAGVGAYYRVSPNSLSRRNSDEGGMDTDKHRFLDTN